MATRLILEMTPEQALARMGLTSFRGRQAEAVAAMLSGRDTMVLMATSGGKSLCYTVPALCAAGYAVVVSPLLALMDDQQAGMEARGVRAAAFRGGQSHDERADILSRAARGEITVLLMPPEILATPQIQAMLGEAPPSFVAFDEAHCISTWGQDFRPDYADVGRALAAIGLAAGRRIPRMAVTATASRRTCEDIVRLADLRDPVVIASSLARDNIGIFVRHAATQDAVDTAIADDIAYFGKASGIIYCRTRKECERLAGVLAADGVRCVVHHSGMPRQMRHDAAQSFMKGQVAVMVATIGFGMGIDKADVRYVLHNGISTSPEAWYQEIGRGGRDGNPAAAVTYVTPLSTAAIRSGSSRREDGWGAAQDYAAALYGTGCRMQAVMRCFGEAAEACGRCDSCLGRAPARGSAVFDGRLLEAVRDLPGLTPGKYLRAVASSDLKPEAGLALDILFAAGLIDYEIVSRPAGPPIVRLAMTAGGLRARQPDLEAPLMLDAVTRDRSPRGLCDLIAARCAYDGRSFTLRHAETILSRYPRRQEIAALDGLRLPPHLIEALAPHDRSNETRPARERRMQAFRL